MARIWHKYSINGTIMFKEYIAFTIVNYNMIFKKILKKSGKAKNTEYLLTIKKAIGLF